MKNERKSRTARVRKPPWLTRKLPTAAEYELIRSMIGDEKLHTVCQEAMCPNQFECFSKGTATFLIMGSRCTRNCRFCNVAHGPDSPPDENEPKRVARVAARMNLRYVVVTSVTRDDLPDGGARFFAETIREIRKEIPESRVEVLIPDFQGAEEALKIVLNARPDVLNHNVETVKRLYPTVRPGAGYERSLELLNRVREHAPDIPPKSGMMLGLGERDDEIRRTLVDLFEHGCRFLTLGQYLQPSKAHLPVERFVTPEEFENWRDEALKTGFRQVASGPLVRSSYHAGDLFLADSQEKS